jgi:iron complex transport system permease protein
VGVGLSRLRTVLFLTSGVLTAGSVVLAGPIGFVGLICPHAVRLLAGPGHRVLVLGSALAGAALVVGCDALVRVVDLGTGQLPIGVLTSLLGGPVLIWLLRREAGR